MKKILILLFSFVITLVSFAQNSQHFKFNGIPIDGNISNFVSKMNKKGFILEDYHEKSVAIMSGKFCGEDVNLFIIASEKSKTVWKVVVDYNNKGSWSTLKSDYSELKELFTKKYGYPEKSFNFFERPYYDGDGYELQALRLEKCHYVSFYNLSDGYISLKISQFGNIQIAYEDKINSEIRSEENENIILNDI